MIDALVLGSTGMLGTAVSRRLNSSELSVVSTSRNRNSDDVFFEAGRTNLEEIVANYEPRYVINNIGIIKQKIYNETSNQTVKFLNGDFPTQLNQVALKYGSRVIQIATDCVFSGESGPYGESSVRDAQDIYGASKKIGEIESRNFLNIRCSIIGMERETNFSLWNWLLSQPENAKVNGYSNHIWNGVTTETFSRLVYGVVRDSINLSGTFHFVPTDYLSKYQLLKLLCKYSDRTDIEVCEYLADTNVDRRLYTEFPIINEQLWSYAGYKVIPSIETLISNYEGDANGKE